MEDGAVGDPPFKESLNNRSCSKPASLPIMSLRFSPAYISVTDNENAGNEPFSRRRMAMTAATEYWDQMTRGAIALKARPGAICASGFSRAQ